MFACEKEEPIQAEPEIQEIEKNYLPLEVGNYWIYQTYKVEESGAETKLGAEDSVVVTNDTLIAGHKYYKIKGTDFFKPEWGTINVIRNASGNLITPNGHIQFSTSNFEDTLFYYDSDIYTVIGKMAKPEDSIIVPAGVFSVLDYRETYRFHMPVPINPRDAHTYYSQNVGLVMETFFFAGSTYTMERRLLRYNVQ